MAWRCSAASNTGLVGNLAEAGLIKEQVVANVMSQVDRGEFVNRNLIRSREEAYMDNPLPIGFGATISAPHIHANWLDFIYRHVTPDTVTKVLDVGCGSGIMLALFARLFPAATIHGIDHIPELVDFCCENLHTSHAALVDQGRIRTYVGDGRRGLSQQAPFDLIHVGAAIDEEDAQTLFRQLSPNGGLFVGPVVTRRGQEFESVVRNADDFTRKKHYGVRFIALTDKEKQLRQ